MVSILSKLFRFFFLSLIRNLSSIRNFNKKRQLKLTMHFNVERFRNFPELLKFTSLITAVLLMLSLAAAAEQPPGTNFVWITTILSIIIESLCIMAIGLELEHSLFPPHSFLNWALIECIFSSLFAINYFISIWLCVNSKNFSNGRTAYSLAATFSLANFVQHTMNVILQIRIWISEQRKAMHVIDPQGMGNPSYGGP